MTGRLGKVSDDSFKLDLQPSRDTFRESARREAAETIAIGLVHCSRPTDSSQGRATLTSAAKDGFQDGFGLPTLAGRRV